MLVEASNDVMCQNKLKACTAASGTGDAVNSSPRTCTHMQLRNVSRPGHTVIPAHLYAMPSYSVAAYGAAIIHQNKAWPSCQILRDAVAQGYFPCCVSHAMVISMLFWLLQEML